VSGPSEGPEYAYTAGAEMSKQFFRMPDHNTMTMMCLIYARDMVCSLSGRAGDGNPDYTGKGLKRNNFRTT
jgi:hypothetical protein